MMKTFTLISFVTAVTFAAAAFAFSAPLLLIASSAWTTLGLLLANNCGDE
jgi:hypothetical protein